jgi:hypothetical protein
MGYTKPIAGLLRLRGLVRVPVRRGDELAVHDVSADQPHLVQPQFNGQPLRDLGHAAVIDMLYRNFVLARRDITSAIRQRRAGFEMIGMLRIGRHSDQHRNAQRTAKLELLVGRLLDRRQHLSLCISRCAFTPHAPSRRHIARAELATASRLPG